MSLQQQYQWDDEKNEANKEKHGISFELARGVFGDANALVSADESHSNENEKRSKIVGRIETGKIVTVVFTKRGEQVRIISAQVRRRDRRVYEKEVEKK